MKVSDNRRPVYGVLTEPLKGTITNKRDEGQTYDDEDENIGYIPKAHVQFLEQSGIVVVPISYLKSDEEIKRELKKVNGVYICGDSSTSISNNRF